MIRPRSRRALPLLAALAACAGTPSNIATFDRQPLGRFELDPNRLHYLRATRDGSPVYPEHREATVAYRWLDILQETGTHVVHCPRSRRLYVYDVHCPAPEMIVANASVQAPISKDRFIRRARIVSSGAGSPAMCLPRAHQSTFPPNRHRWEQHVRTGLSARAKSVARCRAEPYTCGLVANSPQPLPKARRPRQSCIAAKPVALAVFALVPRALAALFSSERELSDRHMDSRSPLDTRFDDELVVLVFLSRIEPKHARGALLPAGAVHRPPVELDLKTLRAKAE